MRENNSGAHHNNNATSNYNCNCNCNHKINHRGTGGTEVRGARSVQFQIMIFDLVRSLWRAPLCPLCLCG
jgi:hypothetical protein